MVAGICTVLAAMILAVFGGTLRQGFVNFDDDVYVYDNPPVAGGLTAHGLVWAFTHVHSSNWHPITWISHMLDCQLYGLNPAGHHLTNLLLHAATTILLFLLLRKMTGSLWRSAFAAAIFAIHPLRVESLAWVAERKDVLSGLFFMLTLHAYVQHASGGRARYYYWLSLLFFALGLMAKPMLVTVPLVLLLLDYWPLKRLRATAAAESGLPNRDLLRAAIRDKWPWFAMAAAAGTVALFAQGEAISPIPFPLRCGNAVVSCGLYLKQLFYPIGLAVFYPYPVGGLSAGAMVTALIALLVISAGAALVARQLPWVVFGWLWYLLMLLPVMGVLQVGAQAHADRYTYLPQIGLAVLLAWTLAEWSLRWHFRRVISGGLAAGGLAALMLCAHEQAGFWRDSVTLWSHALACTEDSLPAHLNLGNALMEKGRVEEAMVHYQMALQMNPDHPEAQASLGDALRQMGRLDEAIGHLEKALEIKPDLATAHNNLGNLLAQRGDLDHAIAHFQQALEARPDYADASYNLGNAHFQKGEWDQAAASYQLALRLKPEYLAACFNLGNTYFQRGKLEAAIACYRQALQINPDYAKAAGNLGAALLQAGRVDAAVRQFQSVLVRHPDDAEAAYNLGNILLQRRSWNEAAGYYRKALQINPDWAEVHYDLGLALLSSGSLSEVIAHFQKAIEIKPDYAEALNNLAWALATAPDASLRDGVKAVALARRANQLAGGNDPDMLDTLAAAYAEAGRFAEAKESAAKAVELARSAGREADLTQLANELQLYSAGLPYHQTAN
jgi:tetratricopeptide (TPR) repeat protein